MSPHLTISDNRDDPGNPLILGGEAIDGAAKAPLTIGQLMVDQVWLEGTDPTGGALYYERGSNTHRRLQAFETGHEAMMTGGWVRVLWAPSRCERSASAWSGPPPTAWCACMASTAACCWWSFWIGLGVRREAVPAVGRQKDQQCVSATGKTVGCRALKDANHPIAAPPPACGASPRSPQRAFGMAPPASSITSPARAGATLWSLHRHTQCECGADEFHGQASARAVPGGFLIPHPTQVSSGMGLAHAFTRRGLSAHSGSYGMMKKREDK